MSASPYEMIADVPRRLLVPCGPSVHELLVAHRGDPRRSAMTPQNLLDLAGLTLGLIAGGFVGQAILAAMASIP